MLPVCSLPRWPSEPRVRPERGLYDLQLCLLSTQTSVRTAGGTRKGQTVVSMSSKHTYLKIPTHTKNVLRLDSKKKSINKYMMEEFIFHTDSLRITCSNVQMVSFVNFYPNSKAFSKHCSFAHVILWHHCHPFLFLVPMMTHYRKVMTCTAKWQWAPGYICLHMAYVEMPADLRGKAHNSDSGFL